MLELRMKTGYIIYFCLNACGYVPQTRTKKSNVALWDALGPGPLGPPNPGQYRYRVAASYHTNINDFSSQEANYTIGDTAVSNRNFSALTFDLNSELFFRSILFRFPVMLKRHAMVDHTDQPSPKPPIHNYGGSKSTPQRLAHTFTVNTRIDISIPQKLFDGSNAYAIFRL